MREYVYLSRRPHIMPALSLLTCIDILHFVHTATIVLSADIGQLLFNQRWVYVLVVFFSEDRACVSVVRRPVARWTR